MFYESIGINRSDLSSFLPVNKFFISEEYQVFDVACALFEFGFPWRRLGKLYRDEIRVFRLDTGVLLERLLMVRCCGIDTATTIGICGVFPQVLCDGDVELLLEDLKMVLLSFDEVDFPVRNEDMWTEVCRKIKLFYDMGCKKGSIGKMMCECKFIFVDYAEEVLAQKMDYFSKISVGRRNVAMLILEYPEILAFDSETSDFSVVGFLKHFGMGDKDLRSIIQIYPYIIGRNKIANLPHVMRALDLHNWLFDQLKKGKCKLLCTYVLKGIGEDVDEFYKDGLEKIRFVRLPAHTMTKLKFIHGVGFGENSLTMKLLPSLHGTGSDLQNRFDCFIELGAEFSKLCRIISRTPKILNQKPDVIIEKVDYLFNEIGLSISTLYQFPAYLNFDLDNRIKPRYRFHAWLALKGVSKKVFSLASIVASSEKTFIARSSLVHPAAPKHYLECFTPFR